MSVVTKLSFNEEKTIGKLIDELFLLDLKLDILIVDDGTDLLPDVVKKKQKKHKTKSKEDL